MWGVGWWHGFGLGVAGSPDWCHRGVAGACLFHVLLYSDFFLRRRSGALRGRGMALYGMGRWDVVWHGICLDTGLARNHGRKVLGFERSSMNVRVNSSFSDLPEWN